MTPAYGQDGYQAHRPYKASNLLLSAAKGFRARISHPSHIKDPWLSDAAQVADLHWVWQGTIRKPDMAPVFFFEGRTWTAWRFSYELSVGEIPEGRIAKAECSESLCVNPAHLVLRTRGHANIRLPYKTRADIRASRYVDKMTVIAIAKAYGISERRVYEVLKENGGAKHLPYSQLFRKPEIG